MTPETETALRESIKYWEAIADGTKGASVDNCALCKRFRAEPACQTSHEACPVTIATGKSYCLETPFIKFWRFSSIREGAPGVWAVTPKAKDAAREHMEFFKSLLPSGEEWV